MGKRSTLSIQNRRLPKRRLRPERTSAPHRPIDRLLELGRRPYGEVWKLQRELHARVAAGLERDTWIVVEHEPVITLGRNAKAANVLVSRAALAAAQVDYFEIERGGDVTYHGPGQVVIYPIRKLGRFREIVPLVRALEEAVIAACGEFGIGAERWSEHAGVWAGTDQICALGLAVQKMTSMHGIALNACTDLGYERLITPCGVPGRGITSLSRASGRNVTFEAAKLALLASLERTFQVEFEPVANGVRVP